MEVKKTKILTSGSLGILSDVPIDVICTDIFSFLPMVDLDYTLIYVSKNMNMLCQSQQTHRMLIERIYGKGSIAKLKPLIEDLIKNRKNDWRKCLKRLISISLRTTVCVDKDFLNLDVILPESPSVECRNIQLSVLKEFIKDEEILKEKHVGMLKMLRSVAWWVVNRLGNVRRNDYKGMCHMRRLNMGNRDKKFVTMNGEGYVKGEKEIWVGVFSDSKLCYGRKYVKALIGDSFRLNLWGYFSGNGSLVEGRKYDKMGKLIEDGSFYEGVLVRGKKILRKYGFIYDIRTVYEGMYENGFFKKGTEYFMGSSPFVKYVHYYHVSRVSYPNIVVQYSKWNVLEVEIEKFVGSVLERGTRFGQIYLTNGSKLKETLKCPKNSRFRVDGYFFNYVLMGYGRIYYPENSLLYEGNVTMDNFHGFGVLYDRNGKIIYEGNFRTGFKCGLGKEYHDDGSTVKFEGRFEKGIPKSGEWFSIDGSRLNPNQT